jgi:hypothetical protein
MKLIAQHQGIDVHAYGSDLDTMMKNGSQVTISARTAQTIRDSMNGKKTNRDACDYVYQSDVLQQNCLSPAISMANFFPVDRRAGMASAIKMHMTKANVPIMPQVVCCPTDIPLLSPNLGGKCTMYTGFVNLVVGFDACMFDQMACDAQGASLDDSYIPMIIESLNLGANYVALNGDDESNVVGLRNNTYIPTEVLAAPAGTNIALELRRVVSLLQSRRNQIIDVSSGAMRQTYTLFLASSIVFTMANTWIAMGNQQFTLLSMLTGDCAYCTSDPNLPTFRVISMDQLNGAWFDGSDLGYLFNGSNNGFLGDVARWHKPYSLLDLGKQRFGLREQRYFAARVGSVEIFDLCNITRLVVPNICTTTEGTISVPTVLP